MIVISASGNKRMLIKRRKFVTRAHSSGFSLIELMMALALGLVITWSVLEVSLTSLRSSQTLNNSSEINETGRYLTQFLQKEISMAGFLGRLTDIPSKSTSPSRWMCRPVMKWDDLTFSIDGLNDMSGTDSLCDTSFQPLAGSDVLMIRRTSSKEIVYSNPLNPNSYYLQAKTGTENSVTDIDTVVRIALGSWDNFPLLEMDATTRMPIYRYLHSFYFIDQNNTFRTMSREDGAWISEPIANSVVDFQVEYGIDTNDDNVADKIGFPANRDEWQALISVKISLLVSGAMPQIVASDTSFFYAGNTSSFTNDRFKRRLFVSVTEPTNLTMRLGD